MSLKKSKKQNNAWMLERLRKTDVSSLSHDADKTVSIVQQFFSEPIDLSEEGVSELFNQRCQELVKILAQVDRVLSSLDSKEKYQEFSELVKKLKEEVNEDICSVGRLNLSSSDKKTSVSSFSKEEENDQLLNIGS